VSCATLDYSLRAGGTTQPMLCITSTLALSALQSPLRPQRSQVERVAPEMMERMPRRIEYGEDARQKLLAGVDQVANAVKCTIGPRGRNVVLESKTGEQRVVNDGVTIAGEVVLDSISENVGVKLLLQAASKTDSRAGDGTTTATVLTQALMKAGNRYISSGHNAMAMQRGLNKGAAYFSKKIRELAEPVTTREQFQEIAAISANDWEMGGRIAEALDKVGLDGSTTLEEGPELFDTLEFTEGMEVDTGLLKTDIALDLETTSSTLMQPLVFVTDQKITMMSEILPILEAVVASKAPLLIICQDLVGEAYSGLLLNLQRGVLDASVIKAPGFGDVRRAYLQDICAFCGANFITADLQLKPSNATLADLGKLDKAVVEKSKTLLVSNGEQDALVDARVAALKALKTSLLEETNKEFEIQRIEQRIVKLRGAVARIRVGAATETEINDRVLRYEDAINALRGAISEGKVPGGGACLNYMTRFADEARAVCANEEEAVAIDVLVAAMQAPVAQIASNAGLLGPLVMERTKDLEWGHGFNAKTLAYENLLEAGVCDPASVTTWALENAASIAGSMLTTQALITDIYVEEVEEYKPEVTADIGADAAKYAW